MGYPVLHNAKRFWRKESSKQEDDGVENSGADEHRPIPLRYGQHLHVTTGGDHQTVRQHFTTGARPLTHVHTSTLKQRDFRLGNRVQIIYLFVLMFLISLKSVREIAAEGVPRKCLLEE